jgi:DNA-binding transcriptional ArsR family regulator
MDTFEIPKVDGRLTQATTHPLRVRFLRLLAHRTSLTAGEARREIEQGGGEATLGEVGYHVRVLERLGAVAVASPATRERGISFRATDIGELLMLAIGAAPRKI